MSDGPRYLPVASVGIGMTLPVQGFDPEDGSPIFDYALAKELGYGIEVSIHIHSENPLQTARKMLVDALAKVDEGIAAYEGDDDPNAIVEGFDVDAAIEGILQADKHDHEQHDDDPPTGQYL